MTNIYSCESIKRRIENHSHYGNCFGGVEYDNFSSKREHLRRCRECYDQVIDTEREIINDNYNNKNLEKKIENLKKTSKIEYENRVKKYNEEEKIESLEYEKKIENIIKTSEINKVQNENELNLLDIDISNLKVEIEQLKEKYEKEIDYKKKNKLNEIKNEYKLKLIKFQNEKEKEKEKKLAENEVRKANFEANKEYEINEMKNKAVMAQSLIVIFKNLLSNN